MQAAVQIATQKTTSREVVLLQGATLFWMLVECSTALTAAYRARSVSLLAFGSDSFVEILSAAVVLLQFLPGSRLSQARAARVCGLLLYVLAAAVAGIAILGVYLHNEADTSRLGIAITVCALLLMPVLARRKRDVADSLNNRALRADSVQSATCAYLAAITLGGQLLHTIVHLPWIDSVAAMVAVPVLIIEARRARQGHTCGCC
ncbi:MAG: hypothetical protein ACRYF4_09665 [Janthinobacterium lividum]